MNYGKIFFRFGGGGGHKKSSENDQLFDWSFSELFFFFFFLNISRTNSETSIKGKPTVCIFLKMFHYFPKNLDRIITFNSVTLKNRQTEPQKYIIFSTKQIIFRVGGEKKILEFFFSSSFWKITVGGFVNQLIKNSGLVPVE